MSQELLGRDDWTTDILQKPHLGWNHWAWDPPSEWLPWLRILFWRPWTQHSWSSFPLLSAPVGIFMGFIHSLQDSLHYLWSPVENSNRRPHVQNYLEFQDGVSITLNQVGRTFPSAGPYAHSHLYRARSHEAGFDFWPCLSPPGHLNKLWKLQSITRHQDTWVLGNVHSLMYSLFSHLLNAQGGIGKTNIFFKKFSV